MGLGLYKHYEQKSTEDREQISFWSLGCLTADPRYKQEAMTTLQRVVRTTAHSSVSFMRILVAWVFLGVVSARKCGTSITKECIGTFDKRYNPQYGTDLANQSLVWEKVEGLYSGFFHTYDPQSFQRILETELVEDFTGTNSYRYVPKFCAHTSCNFHLCQLTFICFYIDTT